METTGSAGGASQGRALVTGASVGIGLEIARCLARRGYDLVLTARREAALEAAAEVFRRDFGVQADVLSADLADPATPRRLMDELAQRGLAVDVLVNNAGFGLHGLFAHGSLEENLAMIQVNVTALVALTRLALPQMLERKRGHILNVASIAAYQPGPLMIGYYASKAYVLSFSEGLDVELAGSGVRVTALCPGPTTSEFEKRAGVKGIRLGRGKKMSAEAVAEAGVKGMLRGRRVVIPGFKSQVTATLACLFPRRWTAAVAHHLNVVRKPFDDAR